MATIASRVAKFLLLGFLCLAIVLSAGHGVGQTRAQSPEYPEEEWLIYQGPCTTEADCDQLCHNLKYPAGGFCKTNGQGHQLFCFCRSA